jgi:hypothetical protein
MNNQLRGDEEFVLRSVANAFSAEWRAGENRPDAYLKVEDREVAIEISILMQNQSDGRGHCNQAQRVGGTSKVSN